MTGPFKVGTVYIAFVSSISITVSTNTIKCIKDYFIVVTKISCFDLNCCKPNIEVIKFSCILDHINPYFIAIEFARHYNIALANKVGYFN